MYTLADAFPGSRQSSHARALRQFADGRGRVPEIDDRQNRFRYRDEIPDWPAWVRQAVIATEHQLGAWVKEQSGQGPAVGFILTATRDCGLGRHEHCPGWTKGGRFRMMLTTLDGTPYSEVSAACACKWCGHAAESLRARAS